MAILTDLSQAELIAKLEALQAQVKAQAQAKFRLKVSDKGAVTMLGLASQYGVTQYAENWLKILDYASEIRDFILANADSLSWKNGNPYA